MSLRLQSTNCANLNYKIDNALDDIEEEKANHSVSSMSDNEDLPKQNANMNQHMKELKLVNQ